MSGETIERARHRWREILPRLGIGTEFLVNKHGPCPLCGGRDRFRFDDKDGSGSYYCNQCGAGAGVILLRKKHAWDFATACREIDTVIGSDSKRTDERKSPTSPNRETALRRLLGEATASDVVDGYLARRGLSVASAALLGHWHCPYYDERTLVGTYPAVLAPIHGPDDTLQSVARIYVADLGNRSIKKVCPPVSTISGGAVRLFPIDESDVLGVAEGIETALAAHELFKVPVWAAISANGIKSFQPPPDVLRVRVFGDNDANFVGQAAAYDLAQRLNRDGIEVDVNLPVTVGTDWLDVLNRSRPR